MVLDNAPNSAKPSTSSLTLPKKGILKRSCSHSGVANEIIDRRDRLSFHLFRTTASEDVKRIPKLSLTWSENNAVAIFGDTTSEETLDDLDDNPSTSKLVKSHSQSPQISSSSGSRKTLISDQHDEDMEELDVKSSVGKKMERAGHSLTRNSGSDCRSRPSANSAEEKLLFNLDSQRQMLEKQKQPEDKRKLEQKVSNVPKEVQSKSLCAGEHKTGLISSITVFEKLPPSKEHGGSNEAVKLFLELEAKKNEADSLEKEMMIEVPLCAGPAKAVTVSPAAAHSEAESSVGTFTMHHDVLLQLQAYQNEIAIWRMKAAHLQSLLKENLQKTRQTGKASSSECIKDSKQEKLKRVFTDAFITEAHQTLPIDNKQSKLNTLEAQLNGLKYEMSQCRNDQSQNQKAMQKIKKESEQSSAEVQAANLTIIRLQDELTTKTKAMEYLEERSQAYRNIILDNDLTVPDESMTNWRRGFLDPRFVANPSKKVQTQLTFQDLQHSEAHLHDLKDRFKVLKEEHNTNESNWREKVREVEESLSAKNYLVELLTGELEKKEKYIAELTEENERAKETFESRIVELSKIADRVPILQLELDRLQQEKSLMHLKLQDVQEEFDAGLENSLTTSLIKFQEQSAYWKEKMDVANRTNEVLRAKIVDLQREQEEMRLRMKVEKADISQRLTSSIQKVDHLRSQINRSTHEVEVEAHPQCNSKYVTCKPHTKNKSTCIRKGELFDELEERLKLCKGELTATRRQVEVLQQKLVDTIQTQAEVNSSSLQLKKMTQCMRKDKATEVNSYLETMQEIDLLREKVDQLEQQNFGLTSALSKVEDEKWDLTVSKHQHITQLAAEFEGEMTKYEDERCRLINRIRLLTKANLERDCLIRCLEGGKVDKTDISRSLSMPYLERFSMVEEFEVSKACSAMLMQMNAKLSKGLFTVKNMIETGVQDMLQKMQEFVQDQMLDWTSDVDVQSLANQLIQVTQAVESAISVIDSNIYSQAALKFGGSRQTLTPSDTEKKDEEMVWNDLNCLRKALTRSWIDRKILSQQLDRITSKFKDLSVRNDGRKIFFLDYRDNLQVMRSGFDGYGKWCNSEQLGTCSSAEELGPRQTDEYFIDSVNLSRSTSWSFNMRMSSKPNN